MQEKLLRCHQAIHTSIRTPMGEGYRIVAASKGLQPHDKQVITRNCPSVDSICLPPEGSDSEPLGISFYTLPTKRLCLALSCFAGEEHTGRGGRRVYTINLVFDAADFADCGYNPFRIVRAMVDAGLCEPELQPDKSLPTIDLCVVDDDHLLEGAGLPAILPEPFRPFVLEQLLLGKGVVVDVGDEWTECAEATLLGVPGPLRSELSFSAGLNFSTSRKHTLQFLSDDKGKAKSRCSVIGATFLPSRGTPPKAPSSSIWTSMAARHWRDGRLAELSRRTSRAYVDTGEDARERLGSIFATLDDAPSMDVVRLATLASEIVFRPSDGAEKQIHDEFAESMGKIILLRLGVSTPEELGSLFTRLVGTWRRGCDGTKFAGPILDGLLRNYMRVNPLVAAQMALDVVSEVPAEVDRSGHDALIAAVLTRLSTWVKHADDPALSQVPDVVARWESVRPHSPELTGVSEHCAKVLAKMTARA